MPSISLKDLSQLDVQLEVNIPCPTWKVSSKQEGDLDYDPVLFARKIADATVNKAVCQATKLKSFKKLTQQRNQHFKAVKSQLNGAEVKCIKSETPQTAYQIHLAQVYYMCKYTNVLIR